MRGGGDVRAPTNATCAKAPLLPLPRLLVVVPGHGEPSRSHVTLSNLARIERMRVRHTCLMFLYGDKLSTELASTRFPQCRMQRQQGYWMHHLRRVSVADVQSHDFVVLLIDGVEMNADVDLQMLAHIMQLQLQFSPMPSLITACITADSVSSSVRLTTVSYWHVS